MLAVATTSLSPESRVEHPWSRELPAPLLELVVSAEGFSEAVPISSAASESLSRVGSQRDEEDGAVASWGFRFRVPKDSEVPSSLSFLPRATRYSVVSLSNVMRSTEAGRP